MTGGLVREPVQILAVLAAGALLTVFGALEAADAAHARATISAWPMLVLGGVAVARLIRLGTPVEGTGWLGWWAGGLAAYLWHLWFGFGAVYHFDMAAVRDGQGTLTAAANALLLILWALSLAAACLPSEPPAESALHVAASLLFAVTALVSTLGFAAHPASVLIGAGLVVLWLHALWRRL
ncbi:MAG: hypothetical protein D6686_03430 [Alphaproteobacteria bacterium]|nr:MAG: hypothetical protein D6686_03430 [Alphaproteobacteria bacterium]